MSAPITLFLIDDHPLLRRGLVALLSQHPDLRVVLFGMAPAGPLPGWATFRHALDHRTLATEVFG